MNKFIFLALAAFSVALAVVGKILGKSYELGFCYADAASRTYDVSCHRLFERLNDSLLYGGIGLAMVFLVLFFVPKAWGAWKKFAIWATPIVALIFATYSGSGGFDMVSPTPETLFKWIAGIYTVISLVIIALAALKKGK